MYKKVFWPFLSRDVENFIRCCKVCNLSKTFRGELLWQTTIRGTAKRFEMLSLDIFGKLALPKSNSFRFIITLQDAATNYCRFIPLKTSSGKEIIKAVMNFWVSYFGFPKRIHADNALEFIKGEAAKWCEKHNVELSSSGVKNSKQNGQVERLNQFLYEQLKVYKLKNGSLKNWDQTLIFISMKYNNSYIYRLNESPQFLMHGKDFNLNFLEENCQEYDKFWAIHRNQALEEFEKSQKKNLKIDEQNKHTILPGDRVFVQTKRTKAKFVITQGPWRVIAIKGNKNYEVLDPTTGKKSNFARENLRFCFSSKGDV